MILLDTSIWIDFFKNDSSKIKKILLENSVVTHDFVLGELLLGGLSFTSREFRYIQKLPCLSSVKHVDIVEYLNKMKLAQTGVGWVDCHLIFSAAKEGHKIWSLDKKLMTLGTKLNCAFEIA